jgi:hypothetical protein
MVRSVAAGLRAAMRQPWLVVLVWALFLGAAMLAAAPAWRWWSTVLSFAPEGDRLLDGLNAALLRELSHYDRSSTYGIALSTFSAFLLATLVMNPFVAGGTIAVLYATHRAAADGQPIDTRVWWLFWRRAAEHYGVFLRMLLFCGIIGVLLGIAFVMPLMPIMHIAENNELERLYYATAAMIPVAVLAAFGLTSILLDIARIRAMREGQRRAWRAILGGIRFLWRNPVASLGIGLTFALLTGLTFVVYFVVASAFTPKSWMAILLAIVLQQLFALLRTALRVSLLGAELALVSVREPVTISLSLSPSSSPFSPAPPSVPPPSPPPAPPPPIEDLPPLA